MSRLLCVALAAALSLIACGDDDDAIALVAATEEGIVGTWDLERVDLRSTSTVSANGSDFVLAATSAVSASEATVTFAPDGTYAAEGFYAAAVTTDDGSGPSTPRQTDVFLDGTGGTWSLDGTELSLTGDAFAPRVPSTTVIRVPPGTSTVTDFRAGSRLEFVTAIDTSLSRTGATVTLEGRQTVVLRQ